MLEHPCRHQLKALLSHTSYNVDSKSCSVLKQVSTACAGGHVVTPRCDTMWDTPRLCPVWVLSGGHRCPSEGL